MEKASVYIQEMQDKNEKLLMDKGGAQGIYCSLCDRCI